MLGHFRQICFISSPALHVASPRPVACDETARAAEAVVESLASKIPGFEVGRAVRAPPRGPHAGGRLGARAPSGRMGPLLPWPRRLAPRPNNTTHPGTPQWTPRNAGGAAAAAAAVLGLRGARLADDAPDARKLRHLLAQPAERLLALGLLQGRGRGRVLAGLRVAVQVRHALVRPRAPMVGDAVERTGHASRARRRRAARPNVDQNAIRARTPPRACAAAAPPPPRRSGRTVASHPP